MADSSTASLSAAAFAPLSTLPSSSAVPSSSSSVLASIAAVHADIHASLTSFESGAAQWCGDVAVAMAHEQQQFANHRKHVSDHTAVQQQNIARLQTINKQQEADCQQENELKKQLGNELSEQQQQLGVALPAALERLRNEDKAKKQLQAEIEESIKEYEQGKQRSISDYLAIVNYYREVLGLWFHYSLNKLHINYKFISQSRPDDVYSIVIHLKDGTDTASGDASQSGASSSYEIDYTTLNTVRADSMIAAPALAAALAQLNADGNFSFFVQTIRKLFVGHCAGHTHTCFHAHAHAHARATAHAFVADRPAAIAHRQKESIAGCLLMPGC